MILHQLLPTTPEEAFLTPLEVATDLGLEIEDLLFLYRNMSLVRLLDRRMLNMQRQGRIGFYGTETGEEAAVLGSSFALAPSDWIFPALRQGGAVLLRGMPLTEYVAQCLGNSADPTLGRQMPSHFSSLDARFVSMSSCIGSQVPQAAGAGIAARLRGDDAVVLGYLGDGATSAPDFHVGMNFAAVLRARTVFFCQNNQWAISLPSRRQTAAESIAIKADSYGIPGVRVDGNDVLAVYQVTRDALGRARAGEGPTLIEAVTYRMAGHSSSDDPGRYRDDEEVSEWAEKDPLIRFKAFLEGTGVWNEEKESALTDELGDAINAAIKAVEPAAPPAVDSLFTDVYEVMPLHLKIQRHELLQRLAAQSNRGNG